MARLSVRRWIPGQIIKVSVTSLIQLIQYSRYSLTYIKKNNNKTPGKLETLHFLDINILFLVTQLMWFYLVTRSYPCLTSTHKQVKNSRAFTYQLLSWQIILYLFSWCFEVWKKIINYHLINSLDKYQDSLPHPLSSLLQTPLFTDSFESSAHLTICLFFIHVICIFSLKFLLWESTYSLNFGILTISMYTTCWHYQLLCWIFFQTYGEDQ